MSTSETDPLAHLRKLPNHSLFDLLLDDPGRQAYGVSRLLIERGYAPEEIDAQLKQRNSRSRRSYRKVVRLRQLALFFAAIVFCFNLLSLLALTAQTGLYMGYMLLIITTMFLFGLYLGLKLNTVLYLGDPQKIHCGFPCPIATIDVDTGEESLSVQIRFYFLMTVNALFAINMTLFPATLLSYLLP